MFLFSFTLCILAGLFFWKIKFNREKSLMPLSMENTIPLRGICAVEIMIGHIGLYLNSNMGLFPFRKAGILPVGVFFFLSAYGLMNRFMATPDYLNNKFLLKRAITILIPAFSIYVFHLIPHIINIGPQAGFSLFNYIYAFLSSMNWFVYEILAFYFLFFLCFKCLKPAGAIVAISFASIFFISIAFMLRIDNPWYGSTLCFPLGLIMRLGKNEILCFLGDKYKVSAVFALSALTISILMFFLLGNESISGNLIGRNVASLSICVLSVLVLLVVRIGNRASNFTGKISYEIFLIHPLIISQSEKLNFHHDIAVYFFVIVSSIVLSVGIYYANQWIKNRLLARIFHTYS